MSSTSGQTKKAVEIPKLWGDLFGTALFSVAVGRLSLVAAHVHRLLISVASLAAATGSRRA